jgi:hypothetical protein
MRMPTPIEEVDIASERAGVVAIEAERWQLLGPCPNPELHEGHDQDYQVIVDYVCPCTLLNHSAGNYSTSLPLFVDVTCSCGKTTRVISPAQDPDYVADPDYFDPETFPDTGIENLNLKPAAAEAVKRGLYIFGVTAGTIKPYDKSLGVFDSMSKPEKLSEWDLTPNMNIGIDCQRSGVCVLHCPDPDADGQMPKVLNEIRTYKVKTPAGTDLYFRGLCRSGILIDKKMDYLGTAYSIGESVIGAGSHWHTSDHVYEVVDDSPIAEMPAAVSDAILFDLAEGLAGDTILFDLAHIKGKATAVNVRSHHGYWNW